MFSLKNNVLTRELSFRLEFDAPVSYEDFVAHDEYMSLFDEKAKSEVISGLTWRGFYTLREIKGLDSYESIFQCLLNNTIEESYHNADRLFSPLSEENSLLYKLQRGENLTKDEKDLLCFYLDGIKFSITNNKYLYKLYEGGHWSKAKLITPFWKYTLETNDGILSKKENKTLREKVALTQTEKPHLIVEYLLFITLVTDADLFLVVNPIGNDFTITSGDKINSSFRGTMGLFVSISKHIRSFVEYSSMSFLNKIKEKYSFSSGYNGRFVADLLEIIAKSPSSKIQINASNGQVKDMAFSVRDQDLQKYSDLKDFKRGESGVTRTTGIEEHGTKKNAVVSTGKIKYGKRNKK